MSSTGVFFLEVEFFPFLSFFLPPSLSLSLPHHVRRQHHQVVAAGRVGVLQGAVPLALGPLRVDLEGERENEFLFPKLRGEKKEKKF